MARTKNPGSRTIPALARLCPKDWGNGPYDYGQALPSCRSPRIGRQTRVRVRGKTMVGVTEACTTPAPPSYNDLARGSPKLCERGFRVRVPDHGAVVAAASRVREWNRTPRAGVCRAWAPVTGASAGAALADARAFVRRGEVAHAHELLRDLPFPHREGSTPLCERSAATPESVLSVYEAWRSGDGYESMTDADVMALARAAVPRGLRSEVDLRAPGDIPRAMRRVQDEGVRQWEAYVARSAEGRRAKFSRVRRQVRERYAPPKKATPAKVGGRRAKRGAVRENPSRFERLVRELEARGINDPRALAASIGRKKYGVKRFAAMSAAGRRRATRRKERR